MSSSLCLATVMIHTVKQGMAVMWRGGGRINGRLRAHSRTQSNRRTRAAYSKYIQAVYPALQYIAWIAHLTCKATCRRARQEQGRSGLSARHMIVVGWLVG